MAAAGNAPDQHITQAAAALLMWLAVAGLQISLAPGKLSAGAAAAATLTDLEVLLELWEGLT